MSNRLHDMGMEPTISFIGLPIRTTRLVLRRFSVEDLGAFQAYRSDPDLARYQGWQPTSDEQARAFLAKQAKQVLGSARQWLQVAVTLSDTGEVIGDLGLCVLDASKGEITLGFTLARSAQRRGYATEAVMAVLDALLGRGRARSVVAVTDVRNAAAEALLRRVGFGYESTNNAIFRGETCQEHTFVLTSEQWVRQH
jgi:RimJ/RimL family protein N-acetyltransferase